jgi:hypothetical protein
MIMSPTRPKRMTMGVRPGAAVTEGRALVDAVIGVE